MTKDPKTYQKEYRDRQKEKGLCVRCNDPVSPISKSRCVAHLQYAKNWQKAHEEAKKQAKSEPEIEPVSVPTYEASKASEELSI